jgi:c(7)-type cytochrome triheme protein
MTHIALRLVVAVLLALFPAEYGAAEWGDITFTRKAAGPSDYPPAVFPHWMHRMEWRCYVCHQDIFKMKAGANPITMQAIRDGKFCGACHNGKTAFAPTFEDCWRCHPK